MKKAFTLIEMLVVIGILGVLTAITLVALSGGTDSALNIKCETNMRTLAAACQNYAMETGYYPYAGSLQVRSTTRSQGQAQSEGILKQGWVGLPDNPTPFISTFSTDNETSLECLTNGVLWRSVSGNREVYRCPVVMNKYKKLSEPPVWTYAMNCYFGWGGNADGDEFRLRDTSYRGIKYGDLKRAERRLLFAELPLMGYEGTDILESCPKKPEFDCTLRYTGKSCEYIGFNHTSGKRDKYALVVFADSHTERIAWPRQGLNEAALQELTKLLCTGKDIVLNGNKYEEVK